MDNDADMSAEAREVVAHDLAQLHTLLDRVVPGWYGSTLAAGDDGTGREAVRRCLPIHAAMQVIRDADRWGLLPSEGLVIDLGIDPTVRPAAQRAARFRRAVTLLEYGPLETGDLIAEGNMIEDAARSDMAPEAQAGRRMQHAANLIDEAMELLRRAARELDAESAPPDA